MAIPVLMYGSEYWTMRKEDDRRILVGCRNVLQAPKNTHNLNTTAQPKRRHKNENQNAGDNSRHRIEASRLWWFGHVSRMDSERISYLALHTKVDGVQSRGRPRERWRDGFMDDIKEGGLELSKVTSLITDRLVGGS
jgi:hypothetical protein